MTTTTYRIEIHENNIDNCSNNEDCVCCRKEMAHEATRIFRRKKRINNKSNETTCSSIEERIKYKKEPISSFTSSNSSKCTTLASDNFSILKNSPNFEYKFYDITVGSILTILIWYLLSKQTGNLLFHVITSAFSLFLITLFKYKQFINEERFWRCLLSNLDSLIQAYCTMLTFCLIICILNFQITKRSNFLYKWSLIAFILLILISYVKTRFNSNNKVKK
jgi:hypothetical protein